MELRLAYGGPRGSGKTTNLVGIQNAISGADLSDYVSMSISSIGKSPIDFLYFELEQKGLEKYTFRIVTLPHYDDYFHLWKMILSDCHGVVVVFDSRAEKMEENLAYLRMVIDSLSSMNITPEDFPIFFQYNKTDLPDALPGQELEERLNLFGRWSHHATALNGEGILRTFMAIAHSLLPGVAFAGKTVDSVEGDMS